MYTSCQKIKNMAMSLTKSASRLAKFSRLMPKRWASSDVQVLNTPDKLSHIKFTLRPVTEAEHKETKLWLWISIATTIALPFCYLHGIIIDPDNESRIPFQPHDHLRIRKKKFPWGDGNHNLLYCPNTNALPDGYEFEETEHHH